MKTTDSIGSSTTQRHGNAAKTGEQIKLQNSEPYNSNESKTGKLKRKLNACAVCEIVLPELEEEIARLKNKIKKLKEQNDNDVD
jgi:hypothetical protein